ncbi:MAG: hypothetical protein U9R74_11890 [Pseudomonadota bacterium]|nr:hypothetical protein [Pseudomonadota bacterium]
MPFEQGTAGEASRGVALDVRPGPTVFAGYESYILHPREIPVRVTVRKSPGTVFRRLENPGLGGVRLICREPYRPGLLVGLDVRVCGEWRQLRGIVVSLRDIGVGYEVGMGFLSRADAFEGRMLEQACHIESYKLGISRTQGRNISAEQAAREWIGRFSATFPPLCEPEVT